MFALTRQLDEAVVIKPNGREEDQITIRVVKVAGGARLSFDAPKETTIYREDLLVPKESG